jgi:hypothetical protein
MKHWLYPIEFWSGIVVFFWILILIINGEAWPIPAPKKGGQPHSAWLSLDALLSRDLQGNLAGQLNRNSTGLKFNRPM